MITRFALWAEKNHMALINRVRKTLALAMGI